MSKGPLFDASKAREAARGFRSLDGELHRLGNPTMLLWGANDHGASVERAVLLLEALSSAELHVFNDCARISRLIWRRQFPVDHPIHGRNPPASQHTARCIRRYICLGPEDSCG